MKPERTKWKRTKHRNQVYDVVTEEFSRDVACHRSLAYLDHRKAIEAFGNVYDETRDNLSQRNQ
jgi:hypothetical protein